MSAIWFEAMVAVETPYNITLKWMTSPKFVCWSYAIKVHGNLHNVALAFVTGGGILVVP